MANEEKVQGLATEVSVQLQWFMSSSAKVPFFMNHFAIFQYVKNFEAVRYYTTRYFRAFTFCEFLNGVVLMLVFHFTNAFLGREFSSYGSDVVRYYSKDLVRYPNLHTWRVNVIIWFNGCFLGYSRLDYKSNV